MRQDQGSILIIISNQIFYNNYLNTKALSKIKNRLIFLVDCNVKISKNLKNVIWYSYPKNKALWHEHLFNINMCKFSGRSKTFKFRLLRLSKTKRWLYRILAFPIVSFLAKLLILKLTDDQKLFKIIGSIKPSLILIPSMGYEGMTFETIKVAKKYHVPSCVLVDNWDNLSSKTIFTRKPDYITVWGKQSREHAEKIHGIDSHRISILGTPRFIDYFSRNNFRQDRPYSFKYAVFAGNALAFDELTTLKKLDEILEKNSENITIIYRPHPWRHVRKCADTFFEYDFKHIKLDTEAKNYYKKELGTKFVPDLDYFPKLLANMEFMICPLSTMLIESLIFDKKVYVLTYDDGVHFTNPKNAFRYYEHFRGIRYLPNVEIIENFDDLNLIFKNSSSKRMIRRTNLNYYISPETVNYPENLLKLSETIISNWKT